MYHCSDKLSFIVYQFIFLSLSFIPVIKLIYRFFFGMSALVKAGKTQDRQERVGVTCSQRPGLESDPGRCGKASALIRTSMHSAT